MRPNTHFEDDDHVPLAQAAGGYLDPFRKPDYLSKKHSRPHGRLRTKKSVCRTTIRRMLVDSEVV